jgi:hypothetical protein
MTRFNRSLKTLSRAAMMLTAAWALAQTGCGNLDRSPVGSSEGVSDNTELTQPVGYLVFSQRAAVRASKYARVKLSKGQFKHKESKWLESDENEDLKVSFGNYGHKKDVRKLSLS